MQSFSKDHLLQPRAKTTGGIILTALCYLLFVAGIAAAAASFWMETKPTVNSRLSPPVIVLTAGLVWAFLWGAGILYAASMRDETERERRLLLEHGKFGKARILYTEQDGDVAGANIAIEMFLEIQIDGQEPFHIKEKIIASIYDAAQFAEGKTRDVLIAPATAGAQKRVIRFLDHQTPREI